MVWTGCLKESNVVVVEGSVCSKSGVDSSSMAYGVAEAQRSGGCS